MNYCTLAAPFSISFWGYKPGMGITTRRELLERDIGLGNHVILLVEDSQSVIERSRILKERSVAADESRSLAAEKRRRELYPAAQAKALEARGQ